MFHSLTVIRLTAVLAVLHCAFCFSATAQTDTPREVVQYRFTSMITADIGVSTVTGELYDRAEINGGMSFGGVVRARAYKQVYIGYIYTNQVLEYERDHHNMYDDDITYVVSRRVRQHEIFALLGMSSNPSKLKSRIWLAEIGIGVVSIASRREYTPTHWILSDYTYHTPYFSFRLAAGLIVPIHRHWGVNVEGNSRLINSGIGIDGDRGWTHGLTVGVAYMVGGR